MTSKFNTALCEQSFFINKSEQTHTFLMIMYFSMGSFVSCIDRSRIKIIVLMPNYQQHCWSLCNSYQSRLIRFILRMYPRHVAWDICWWGKKYESFLSTVCLQSILHANILLPFLSFLAAMQVLLFINK